MGRNAQIPGRVAGAVSLGCKSSFRGLAAARTCSSAALCVVKAADGQTGAAEQTEHVAAGVGQGFGDNSNSLCLGVG